MSKHATLLHRVCYRIPSGKDKAVIHQGPWMYSYQICNRLKSEMAAQYGEENTRIETIDKRTGREVYERDDDDQYGGGEDN